MDDDGLGTYKRSLILARGGGEEVIRYLKNKQTCRVKK